MKGIEKYKRSAISISIIVISIFFLTTCISRQEENKALPTGADANQFAGSATCAGCHKNIYESHINTAHFHTSEKASEKNISGSFEPGKNSFSFNNGGTITMEKKDSGFYQTVYINGVQKKSQRFDIIFGSGTKGQSYATWQTDHLLQLPITWFTSADQWSNSPGYPNKILLNRLVTSRCLECHTTFAKKTSDTNTEAETFQQSSMVLGVGCERCHGPAAQHAAYQTGHPKETTGQFIIKPASFTRLQSVDMCTLCHGGRLQKTKPSFTFKAGDRLADYFLIDSLAQDPNAIDVHGNQYGLLAASKCFRVSKTLTCITCHDPHKNEKGNTASFSQKCLGCHNNKGVGEVLCTLTSAANPGINTNCTNCHMPEQPSKAIAVLLQGLDTLTPALMHTHFIKSYPEETKKILAFIKGPAHTTVIKDKKTTVK